MGANGSTGVFCFATSIGAASVLSVFAADTEVRRVLQGNRDRLEWLVAPHLS